MSRDDPYHDIKKYHMAAYIYENGSVKPLCRESKINLKKRETWTIRREAVTCKKCLELLKQFAFPPGDYVREEIQAQAGGRYSWHRCLAFRKTK